jgi:hypothetical protein
MVIVAPAPPVSGVKDVKAGAAIKLNPAKVAEPPGVVTTTSPEVPEATVAVMLVLEFTTNEAAAVPPKLTPVAPLKLLPVIVIVAPDDADAGVKDEIVGAAINVNPFSDAVPADVVTATSPDEPVPTVAVILVGLFTVKEAAAVPPKLTLNAPVKLVPVIVTIDPFAAAVGVNDLIVGGDSCGLLTV